MSTKQRARVDRAERRAELLAPLILAAMAIGFLWLAEARGGPSWLIEAAIGGYLLWRVPS